MTATIVGPGGQIDADLSGDEHDLDTGAGTDLHEVVAVGLPAAGGHVVGGTAANPFRTDPTGTTTQPVAESTIVKRFDAVTPKSAVYTSAGDHDFIVPSASTKQIRAVWLFAQAAGALGDGTVEVVFKWEGATEDIYRCELTGSQPFAHSAVLEAPSVNKKLIVNTSSTAKVFVNADYREY